MGNDRVIIRLTFQMNERVLKQEMDNISAMFTEPVRPEMRDLYHIEKRSVLCDMDEVIKFCQTYWLDVYDISMTMLES